MTVVRIDVETRRDRLVRVARRLRRLQPVLRDIGDELQRSQEQRFGSVRFQPLTPAYARRKSRRGLSTRPLAGGELERAVGGRGRYAVRRLSSNEVVVGIDDPVARIHGAGGRFLPRRAAIVNPSRQVRARLVERMRRHVLEGA